MKAIHCGLAIVVKLVILSTPIDNINGSPSFGKGIQDTSQSSRSQSVTMKSIVPSLYVQVVLHGLQAWANINSSPIERVSWSVLHILPLL